MKKVILLIVSLLPLLTANAGVTFKFAGGTVAEGTSKPAMERTISALLTELHDAGTEGRAPMLDNINMEEGARAHLLAFWEALPFVCERTSVVSRCLNDMQGYQVRGINIIMRPVDSSYDGDINRELTVSLNNRGVITGVRPALELQESVEKIMGSGNAVTDTRQRREILKFVEDFRCYYNEKNLDALNKIFSEDALIITGSVISRRQHSDVRDCVVADVRYKKQSKQQYLENLKRVFVGNRYINVEFDQIRVVNHPSKKYLYGVTLHQKWSTTNYSDRGWLFMIWDFSKPNEPQIHVRAWQPNEIIAGGEDVFVINDFFIP